VFSTKRRKVPEILQWVRLQALFGVIANAPLAIQACNATVALALRIFVSVFLHLTLSSNQIGLCFNL
jgi:hypothetical protein